MPQLRSHPDAPPQVVHPLIVATPEVCGGAARLIRTRIPVWTLERLRQLGVSDTDLLRCYPTLRPVDLIAARAYAADHADEIAAAIAANENAGGEDGA